MNDVIFTEKTEVVEDSFCPFLKGKCQFGCKLFLGLDDRCMIEQIYHNTVEILERMDEAERKAAETAMYQD